MKVTISGGTGFVGRHLARRMLLDGHEVTVLTRALRPGMESGLRFGIWDAERGEPPADTVAGADAVVHLAGEPVSQRWTPVAKQKIASSRIDGTRHLINALSTQSRRPAVLVCASAVGIYGSRGDEIITEESPAGTGWLAEVSQQWEHTATLAEALGIRVVRLRIGIVLGKQGGALARILPVFRAGLGGKLGSGSQWMSWIHMDDLIGLILFALENESLRGAVNATAPEPVRNAEFTEMLGRVLKRPALLPAPAFAIRALFGEMSEIVLGGQRVLPTAAQKAGYQFRYPALEPALRQVVS